MIEDRISAEYEYVGIMFYRYIIRNDSSNNYHKYMKDVMRILIIISVCFLCYSCSDNSSGSGQSDFRQAKGGKFYGGVFRINETEYIKNLFPHNITDAFSYRVASQIYEGLFKFDPQTLEVTNGLVDHFTVDASGIKYTFHIKRGVLFHDNTCFPDGKGREMNARDVRYCFTKLCTKSLNNQHFSIFKGISERCR
ncbi:MAG: hypothetical protein U5K79_03990 [Cyclobacteriaceae bacterium]|nr:hypothetical protein [Cyclobacteriaceae bacterium]